MTTTAKPRSRAAKEPPASAPDETGEGVRRSRTTVTVGPFLVALTERDRQERRPTVVVAVAYVAPADRALGSRASAAVQERLWQVLRDGIPVVDLQQVTEALYDGLAEPRWPAGQGEPVEHGIALAQVAVSLLPRDPTSDQIQPVATVVVSNPSLAPPGSG
jgi:hypothetical protein